MANYLPLHELYYARAYDTLVSCLSSRNRHQQPNRARNLSIGRQSPLASTPPNKLSSSLSKSHERLSDWSTTTNAASLDGTGVASQEKPLSNGQKRALSSSFSNWINANQSSSVLVSPADLNRRDDLGRTVLHLVASTVEDSMLAWAESLLGVKGINVNLQDVESGWTPLHRAMYVGNLAISRLLIGHPTIDIYIRDAEGLTAFDVYNSTIRGTNPAEGGQGYTELFTWGTNRNYVLGVPGDGDRPIPEKVSFPAKIKASKHGADVTSAANDPLRDSIEVLDVDMAKMHSAILTNELGGTLRMCGFGNGGRLGQSPKTIFTFEPLPNKPREVVNFALGQDHTAYVTKGGELYTFGLGLKGQLGYTTEAELSAKDSDKQCVQSSPRRVVSGVRKDFIVGVASSRIHTVCYSSDASVYTWGTNMGQLGYASGTTPLQLTPRKVPLGIEYLKQVVATEVATAMLTDEGEVWVLHANVTYKIPFTTTSVQDNPTQFRTIFKKIKISKISASGTHFIATSEMGDLYYWSLEQSTSSTSARRDVKPQRVWDFRRSFTAVSDACICDDGSILLCTRSGHVFLRTRRAEVKAHELKMKNVDRRQDHQTLITPTSKNGSSSPSVANTSKQFYQVTKIPFLQRITRVVAHANSFAAIRKDVKPVELPYTVQTSFQDAMFSSLPFVRRHGHFPSIEGAFSPIPDIDSGEESSSAAMFYEREISVAYQLCLIYFTWESNIEDADSAGTDLTISVGEHRVSAHKCILAARSNVLNTLFNGSSHHPEGIQLDKEQLQRTTLVIRNTSLLTILLLLHYMYTDNVIAIWDPRVGRELRERFSTDGRKVAINIIRDELQRLAHLLQLPQLAFSLGVPSKRNPPPSIRQDFDKLRTGQCTGGDILLRLSRRETMRVHSAILKPQSSFFNVLFSDVDWTLSRTGRNDSDEVSNDDATIEVDLEHLDPDIMNIVMRHLYSIASTELFHPYAEQLSTDKFIDLVYDVMAVADELLLDRLKVVCSETLCPLVNLSNVCSILAEAETLDAKALQLVCHHYISCNLETMMESRYLDVLTDDELSKLSEYVRKHQYKNLQFARSGAGIQTLVEKYGEWLSEQDVPEPNVGYFFKRNSKGFTSPSLKASSPKASSLSSPGLLPTLSASASPSATPALSAADTPRMSSIPIPPSSHAIVAEGDGDETPFQMDSFDESYEKAESSRPLTDSTQTRASSANAWGKLSTDESIPSLDLRQIMQDENNSNSRNSSTATAVGAPPRPAGSMRVSQRERKRISSDVMTSSVGPGGGDIITPPNSLKKDCGITDTSSNGLETKVLSASRTEPVSWRLNADDRQTGTSLAKIQAEQASEQKTINEYTPPKQSTTPTSKSGISTEEPSTVRTQTFTRSSQPQQSSSATAGSASGQPSASFRNNKSGPMTTQSLHWDPTVKVGGKTIAEHIKDPASAIGAPVITPERGEMKSRKKKNEVAWGRTSQHAPAVHEKINSSTKSSSSNAEENSAASATETDTQRPKVESLMSISLRQEEENSAARRKNPPKSLSEIQQEEAREAQERQDRDMEEKKFLAWWEEEQAKVMAANRENESSRKDGKKKRASRNKPPVDAPSGSVRSSNKKRGKKKPDENRSNLESSVSEPAVVNSNS